MRAGRACLWPLVSLKEVYSFCQARFECSAKYSDRWQNHSELILPSAVGLHLVKLFKLISSLNGRE